jgi:predicted NAD/FAD-binding protein
MSSNRKKIAIVGSGIAGMSAAYFLKDDHDISLFEKNDYIGGHTNTVEVFDGQKDCPVDTGFMVFNDKTYPNLLKLFEELQVPYKNTCMSFSVRNEELDLEYNGSSLNGLFSQRKNIFNLKFINMIRDIMKFNQHAKTMLEKDLFGGLNIFDYCQKLGLKDYFIQNFLFPMSSAVWSTPLDKMGEFPAKSLVRFFDNHGFVGKDTQLQWKTVTGGSREYRNRLTSSFKERIYPNSRVEKVIEQEQHVDLIIDGERQSFDQVVIASHGDDALNMLDEPSEQQRSILKHFKYQENQAIVHTDSSVMPKLKTNWSSWNFIMKEKSAYTVYYMNRLQDVSKNADVFININGDRFVDEKKIIKEITYHHPLFSLDAVEAQVKIDELNKNSKVFFTGSYYRYGFHEDALLSSVRLCESILKRKVLA